jgi:phosphoribosylformylglycinamidine cyclo-ligase
MANAKLISMHRVFNCGIGLVVVVPSHAVSQAIEALKAEQLTAWQIGEVVERPVNAPQTIVL